MTWHLVCSFCCMIGLCRAQQPDATPRIQPRILTPAEGDGRVMVVHLAPRYSTTIRMEEPVNSVVLGDPASFSAEHSDQEPNLVIVKPITAKPAQTNLLISTAHGHQASLLLISRGDLTGEQQPGVDFVVRYRPAGRFLIEPDEPSWLVAQTVTIADPPARAMAPGGPAPRSIESGNAALDELLERQRKAPLPQLYGEKPGVSNPGKELVKAGVGDVIDRGREVVVLFSVVNPQKHSIELMPPQIQLGGKIRSGRLIRKSRWATAEQFPIADYRFSDRRLGPGERADGVVVFNRPPYKQSNETLFLQIAESGAVDRPALAPIGFGIDSLQSRKEDSDGKRSGNQ